MDRIAAEREASQPLRSRTGGSTFKNPPGTKAWQLIDEAGCRGLRIGDAQVSEKHCNFLLNLGEATLGRHRGAGRGGAPPGQGRKRRRARMGNPAGGRERMDRLHVAVLMGGWSAEREVSLITGKGVAEALESRGHRVTRIDMGRDVAQRLAEAAPDVVFNALHGTPGEDGTVQGLMDLMGLNYTHSGLETSVIAIDKELTKMVLVPHGIRMPDGRMVDEREPLRSAIRWPRPYVLKPVNEGSSVGVAIVTAERQLWQSDRAATSKGPWQQFDRLLAEPFIRGRELTVAVLGDEALAVTELRPKSGFYDYDAKYTDGHDRACLPGRHSRRHSRRGARHGARRAPPARLHGRVALRFPLGRRSAATPGSICSRSTPSPA